MDEARFAHALPDTKNLLAIFKEVPAGILDMDMDGVKTLLGAYTQLVRQVRHFPAHFY